MHTLNTHTSPSFTPSLRLTLSLALWLAMSLALLGSALWGQAEITGWMASNPILNVPLLYYGLLIYIGVGLRLILGPRRTAPKPSGV